LSKIAVSMIGSAAILGSVVVTGVALSGRTGPGARGAVDLSLIESELAQLRESMDGVMAELRALRRESQGIRAPLAVEAGADPEEAPADALEGALPGYVAAVLAEERKLQEAERERQREERRVRMEERRKELEAMREGPYDRYNVKVNSLAKVLNLTDAQKQSYYDLVAAYSGKVEESMKQLREAREAERAAAAAAREGGEQGQEGERGRGRRGDAAGREQFREMYDGLQKSFASDVASLLSAEQAQTYGELSRSAQSFQSTDLVAAPGEGGDGGGRFAGFGGGGSGGGFGGGRAGGGPGGGGRRGR
jgi:hypothetical protein